MDVLNPESVSVAHEAVKSGYPVMSADWKIDVLKEQVLTSVRRIDEYRGILAQPPPSGRVARVQGNPQFP